MASKQWDRCLYCDASIAGDDAHLTSPMLHDPYCPHGKTLVRLGLAMTALAALEKSVLKAAAPKPRVRIDELHQLAAAGSRAAADVIENARTAAIPIMIVDEATAVLAPHVWDIGHSTIAPHAISSAPVIHEHDKRGPMIPVGGAYRMTCSCGHVHPA